MVGARPNAGVFSFMRCFKFSSSSKSDFHVHTYILLSRNENITQSFRDLMNAI